MPKQIVYLLGAGATQAEVDYLGAAQVFVLMRDSRELGREGLSTAILRKLGRLGIPFSGTEHGVDIEKLISLLIASGVESQAKLAERMRRLYFNEIRLRLTKAKVIRRPQLAQALFEMHNNDRFKAEVETLSGILTTNHDGLKRTVENWTLAKLLRETPSITFPEYQREKRLWSAEKKALLIDTILEDIDIPKLYFNKTADGNYEVVDGQQRLWAIWDYFGGEYAYKTNKFWELTAAQQKTIGDYTLQITVFEDADDAYLRKLFVRLQIALLLVSGEKLHALTGAMKDLVFGELVSHRFLKALGFSPKRYAKQTLCAQICINAFMRTKTGTFATTRFENLQHFFNEYAQPKGKDKQLFETMVKRITLVMNELWKAFGDKSDQLTNRSYILSIYLFFDELLGDRKELPKEEGKQFVEFTFLLWRRLKEEAKKGFDRTNKELYTFGTYLNSAPTEKYQIDNRHQKLAENYKHFQKNKKIKGD